MELMEISNFEIRSSNLNAVGLLLKFAIRNSQFEIVP